MLKFFTAISCCLYTLLRVALASLRSTPSQVLISMIDSYSRFLNPYICFQKSTIYLLFTINGVVGIEIVATNNSLGIRY